MSEYKQCPNGHFYQGDHCPYCKNTVGVAGGKTEIFGAEAGRTVVGETLKTEAVGDVSPYAPTKVDGPKTTVVDSATAVSTPKAAPTSNRTMFGDEDLGPAASGKPAAEAGLREARKLVGWLVSYTLDEMGVDFKLYEGRNIIGRDMDCNITVNDKMVSGHHAVLLFRAGKYSITDSQSSHGTFVNGEDIELEPRYIKDGDTITVGQTRFLFRTSL